MDLDLAQTDNNQEKQNKLCAVKLLQENSSMQAPVEAQRTLLDKIVSNPLTSAMAARASYLGLTGQLNMPSISDVERTLNRLETPVAKQLLERLHDARANNWIFRPTFRTNPFVCGRNYHYLRIIEYSPLPSVLTKGGTLKEVTAIVSHELAHNDRLLSGQTLFGVSPMSTEELRLVAQRELIKEARAFVTEMHISDSMGSSFVNHSSSARGDLGRFIRRVYMSWCPALASISPKEASSIVNSYLDKTFGPNLIDPVTKKVRAFDINAGVGANIGSLAIDRAAFEAMDDPFLRHTSVSGSPYTKAGDKFWAFAETKSGRVLINSGKTLGAIATLAIVSDLNSAFKESPAAGIARAAKVASGWLSFEGGAAVAGVVTRRYGQGLRTVGALLTGFGTACLSDSIVGDPLEKKIKSDLGKIGLGSKRMPF